MIKGSKPHITEGHEILTVENIVSKFLLQRELFIYILQVEATEGHTVYERPQVFHIFHLFNCRSGITNLVQDLLSKPSGNMGMLG